MAPLTRPLAQALRDQSFDPVLRWTLLAAATCLGTVILWDYRFIGYVIVNDHTYVSQVVFGLFAVASGWVLRQLWALGLELRAIEGVIDRLEEDPGAIPGLLRAGPNRGTRSEAFVSDVIRARQADAEAGTDALFGATASEIRGPVRLGLYMSDALYKLGILGTVIGFILMLSAFRDLGQFDATTLRAALQRMTEGMAISLLTTNAGIATGMLLRLQVNILDSPSLKVTRRLVRVADVLIPSAMARR